MTRGEKRFDGEQLVPKTFGEFFLGSPVLQMADKTVVGHNLIGFVAVYELPPGVRACLLDWDRAVPKLVPAQDSLVTEVLVVNGLLPETPRMDEYDLEPLL